MQRTGLAGMAGKHRMVLGTHNGFMTEKAGKTGKQKRLSVLYYH